MVYIVVLLQQAACGCATRQIARVVGCSESALSRQAAFCVRRMRLRPSVGPEGVFVEEGAVCVSGVAESDL